MPAKEDFKPFEINSFLTEFRSQISKRKKRFQEHSSSKHLDIFADNRAKLMVKKISDANYQSDIKRLIEFATDRPSVEGENSPLSPFNTDLLFFNEDNSSSSIYFEWSCTDCPLYMPKMCNCGTKSEGPHPMVCNNESCEGLLKIPYSLIQIPLNRTINSVQSFVSENMGIPNSTLIYYGKLKNSLLLVLFNKEQERNLVKALYNASNSIGCIALYDIFPDNNKSRSSRRPYTTKLKYTGQINNLYK
ncbi:uncharacterized protein ELE39_000900 [Cryptosporidium sp. chipmunk genotype I]|uniref:uncharacterized protein n=1 Tax=Cryptosporidium sp. chipmunk genotype I TaxID=1280935 RepID=UPI003519DB44|nr:hypothetical protein ELE39_000900 [Cryptosporidium sp. chipmunk genotype I]